MIGMQKKKAFAAEFMGSYRLRFFPGGKSNATSPASNGRKRYDFLVANHKGSHRTPPIHRKVVLELLLANDPLFQESVTEESFR